MYDSAITIRSLRGVLRRSDLVRNPKLRDERVKSIMLHLACRLARRRPIALIGAIKSAIVRGRRVNFVASVPLELAVRKLNANLRFAYHTRSVNRTELVRAICEAAKDSNAYTLLRLDIKSFYESVNTGEIFANLETNQRIGASTLRILRSINDWHAGQGGNGLPRGLSTSATLSELCLIEFDRSMRNNKNFFYYGRFADDILLVGAPELQEKQTYRSVRSQLPDGLKLNQSKSKFLAISKAGPNNHQALTFEYLGYQVKIFNNGKNMRRRAEIDIAEPKCRKIKTRIVKSFEDFAKNSDFDLLDQRLRFLSSNYKVIDKNGKFSRLAGIHFSYPLVNHESSAALRELDRFLRGAVLSGKGKFFTFASANLSKSQKLDILRNSFLKGFVTRSIRHFSPKAMSKIQDCWKYV